MFCSQGAVLTIFVVVSIGTTLYEIVLLVRNSARASTPWLVVRVVFSGIWILLFALYLAWLVRDPYIVPVWWEVVLVAAAL